MLQFIQYYGRFQDTRSRVTELPLLGRLLIVIAALPGLVLAALSVAAFAVSILALLLLTVPAYRLVTAVAGLLPRKREVVVGEEVVVDDEPAPVRPAASAGSPGRRHVDVRIIES